jgi:hypothetical protein
MALPRATFHLKQAASPSRLDAVLFSTAAVAADESHKNVVAAIGELFDLSPDTSQTHVVALACTYVVTTAATRSTYSRVAAAVEIAEATYKKAITGADAAYKVHQLGRLLAGPRAQL